jgi:hypothetical protein
MLLKRRSTAKRLHGAISQKAIIFRSVCVCPNTVFLRISGHGTISVPQRNQQLSCENIKCHTVFPGCF